MRIAVLGGGPVGLEAAAQATTRGHDAVVYEADRVAAHVREWGHVRLFTPWRMNVSAEGLSRAGLTLADPEAFPTGAEFVEHYLEPLAGTLNVREHTRVVQIGRTVQRKGTSLGSDDRAEEPFRLLVQTPDGQDIEHADVILDCTGVYSDPSPAGAGGVLAPGEQAAARSGRVRYGPTPVDDLAGMRVLLVGAGASAVSVLEALLALSPPPEIRWITPRVEVPSFVSPPDDILDARRALYELGRSAPEHPMVTQHAGTYIHRLFDASHGAKVTLTNGNQLEVDQILVCTGFRPDHSLSRELQVHVCWGTEGPMTLAAALLASSGAGADCLSQPVQGADTLRSPEPRFFILGNKSYGRRSDFLMSVGYRQVQDALDLLEADAG